MYARQPQLPIREHLRSTRSTPPREYQDGSRRNDRLTPCCDRYTSNRRCARPFHLQRPPPHSQRAQRAQRAQRTPLNTSPERPVNQPYFATIPFRAVIRPIRDSNLLVLTREINATARALGVTTSAELRSPSNVCMKLMNFRAVDPDVEAKGLSQIGKRDAETWSMYAGNPNDLHQVADTIRAGSGWASVAKRWRRPVG